MNAPRFDELRQLTDEQLIDRYNAKAVRTQIGLDFIRQELERREQARQTRTLVRLTWFIAILTLVVTAATVVNVLVLIR